MFLYNPTLLCMFYITLVPVNTKAIDEDITNTLAINLTLGEDLNADEYLTDEHLNASSHNLRPFDDNVKIQLYYECLCPDCVEFDVKTFKPTVEKLAAYLDIKVYPYGNAKTITNKNGTYSFVCQHGERECYGNMLHACAIDYLSNMTKALIFNSCMMTGQQTSDEAADKCGNQMNIDTTNIKLCAKGKKGKELLKYYGDESHKVGFRFVPYILINGNENDGNNFMKDVCAAFANAPPPCTNNM